MMEKRDGMEQGQAIVRVMHCYPGYMGGGAVANAITALAEAEHRAGLQVGIAAFAHNRERTLSLGVKITHQLVSTGPAVGLELVLSGFQSLAGMGVR